MTKSFEQLLYLFGASSRGKELVLGGEPDVEEIRKYAIGQGIWTVVFKKLQEFCDVSKYENEFFSVVLNSIEKIEHNLMILEKLEENGIGCCLLKGVAVARLYHNPECRVSSDTDILITPSDEKKCIKFLSENGYRVEKRSANGHHFQAYHPVGGLLEVHVKLYSRTTEEIVFGGLKLYGETYHEIQINGKGYKTLGINDGLFYLTAHYIKHLISSGGGIRQMMDLLLYMDCYKEEINFENYYSVLRRLRYEKLIKVVMSIGAKYFGFNYEIIEEELIEEVLNDTEKGGVFGHSSNDRNSFYGSYCRRRAKMSAFKYSAVLAFRGESSIWRVLFPSREAMDKLGYEDRFLFVAWIKRFYGVLFRKRPSKVEAGRSGNLARMELMRRLNMIE